MKNFVICLVIGLLAAHFVPVFGQAVIANYTKETEHLAIAREGNVVWLAASKAGVLKCDLAGNIIAFDPDGSAWIGTETGVSHLTSTTGTTEVPQKPASAFRAFPNPMTSGSSLTLEMDLKEAGEVCFTLQDAVGKAVREFSFSEKTIGHQVFNIKTAGVPPGVYFLTVRLEGKVLGTEKVILK